MLTVCVYEKEKQQDKTGARQRQRDRQINNGFEKGRLKSLNATYTYVSASVCGFKTSFINYCVINFQ